MKKTIYVLTVVLLNLALNAQDKPVKGNISTEEKTELKKMRKDLNLSEEQKAKMKEIHKETKANKEKIKAMSKEERKAYMLSKKAQIDTLLNTEQDAKMVEIRKKRREYKTN